MKALLRTTQTIVTGEDEQMCAATKNGRAKLTKAVVDVCRTRHVEGGETFAALAEEFGVSATTIWKAVIGKTWKDRIE